MKLILRTLLKTMSSKLLMEVIMIAIDRMSKKDWIEQEEILRAIGTNVGCKVEIKK